MKEYESVLAWETEARRRFGDDQMDWKFICPVCGFVASVRDWVNAGASEGAVAYSCVGRWLATDKDKTSPCNYAGGGLFQLNPVSIIGIKHKVFEFADSASTEAQP